MKVHGMIDEQLKHNEDKSWSEEEGRTFSVTVTIDNLLLILECFILEFMRFLLLSCLCNACIFLFLSLWAR